MSDELDKEMGNNFDANFSLEEMVLFSNAIIQLENEGQLATATALKNIIQNNKAEVPKK